MHITYLQISEVIIIIVVLLFKFVLFIFVIIDYLLCHKFEPMVTYGLNNVNNESRHLV